jgi:hypothetical protein
MISTIMKASIFVQFIYSEHMISFFPFFFILNGDLQRLRRGWVHIIQSSGVSS